MECKKEEAKMLIAEFEANKKYIMETRKSGPAYGKKPKINIGRSSNTAIDASGKKVYLAPDHQTLKKKPVAKKAKPSNIKSMKDYY